MGSDTHPDPRSVPPGYNPADYERPSVTVDVALFAVRHGSVEVLLIRRKKSPYAGYWALPGGFVALDETLEQTALRELFEETGVADVTVEQLHTYGDPGRDPRTRVISVVYFGLVAAGWARQVQGADDAAEARWWPVAGLPELAFDHGRILRYAHRRLRWKLEHPDQYGEAFPEP